MYDLFCILSRTGYEFDGHFREQKKIMLSFEFYPERAMKSMANLEIYNFYKKYPKPDRKKISIYWLICFY